LIKGDDVLQKIATTPTVYPPHGGGREKSWPVDRMGVESVRIIPREGDASASSGEADSQEKTNTESAAEGDKAEEGAVKAP